jgi:crossover junction endodeoxyribonuclease RuvC
MKILGIDPGYDRCGIALVERDAKTGKDTIVWSACTITKRTDAYHDRLKQACDAVEAAIISTKPDAIAMETLFFNQNTSTALKVAEVRGAMLHIAFTNSLGVVEVSPQEVKLAVTGSGNASKEAIAKMIPKIAKMLEPDRKRLDDELDAISVAIAGLSHARIHLRPLA